VYESIVQVYRSCVVFVSVTNYAHESRTSNWRAHAVYESLVQVYRSCVRIHTSDSYTARALQLLVRDSCTQFVTDTNNFSQSIGAADSYTYTRTHTQTYTHTYTEMRLCMRHALVCMSNELCTGRDWHELYTTWLVHARLDLHTRTPGPTRTHIKRRDNPSQLTHAHIHTQTHAHTYTH